MVVAVGIKLEPPKPSFNALEIVQNKKWGAESIESLKSRLAMRCATQRDKVREAR